MAFFFHAQKNKLRISNQSHAISKPIADVAQIILQHTCSTSDGSFSRFLLKKKKVHKFSMVTQFRNIFSFPLTPKNREGVKEGRFLCIKTDNFHLAA